MMMMVMMDHAGNPGGGIRNAGAGAGRGRDRLPSGEGLADEGDDHCMLRGLQLLAGYGVNKCRLLRHS